MSRPRTLDDTPYNARKRFTALARAKGIQYEHRKAGRPRKPRPTAEQILLLAHRALGGALRLHLASVRIGCFERMADSGILDADAETARDIIEQMDRACALIDRHRAEKRKTT